MTWAIVIALLAAVVGLAWFAGRTGATKKVSDTNARIKDKQLEAATRRPDKSDLVDRLRDGGL